LLAASFSPSRLSRLAGDLSALLISELSGASLFPLAASPFAKLNSGLIFRPFRWLLSSRSIAGARINNQLGKLVEVERFFA
jgi:hypothetical protein